VLKLRAYLGSTTAITSSTGAVVKTYQYDVFGAVRVQTGTQPNEFTFTGEQVDASGLQYLRARSYDNATGRLLSRDPLPGSGAQPQSLNPYPYVLNDPVNLIDPLGLHCRPWHPNHCVPDPVEDFFTETVPSTAQSVGGALEAIASCVDPLGECQHRIEIGVTGASLVVFGVGIGAIACVPGPVILAPTGPAGWFVAGVLCVEGAVAGGASIYGGVLLIQKSVSPWQGHSPVPSWPGHPKE